MRLFFKEVQKYSFFFVYISGIFDIKSVKIDRFQLFELKISEIVGILQLNVDISLF